ncbi:hypothetical protein Tco_0268255 [Tanacetum coccineum]
MILGSLKKFKKQIPKEFKPQSEDTRRTSGNTTRNDPFPPFLLHEAQTQFWCTAGARTLNNGEIELIATVDGLEKTITEASVRRHLKLADADGISTLPTTKIFEQLALMGYVTDSDKLTFQKDEAITKEMHDGLGRATTTSSSLEVEQGSVYHGGSPVQVRPERLSNLPNEPPLGEGNISQSGEGSMQLLELMEICTKLSDKVTTLEDELRSTKVVYNKSLITLTKRGRMIGEINQDKNVNLVKSIKQGEAHETDKHRMESDVDFSTACPQNDDDELTLAETLVNIKRSVEKDKGKAIMQDSEPIKKIKKREMIQIGHDEELAQKLYAKELAKSTTRQEQEKYDFEKALELQKQLDEREENRSFFVAEVGKNMCMYLKNQGGYKLSHFKGMKYEDIRPIFERVWDQNQAFVPKDSEIEKEVKKRSGFIQKQSTKEEKEKKKDEESSKQVEEETVQKEDVIPEQVVKESSRKAEGRLKRKASKPREDKDKRQKKQDDPEKLMEYVEVISDSEEVISVTPLAVKSPIVGWKSYCKEDVGYYEIHRADGSYKTYIFFSQMLNDFDREDLIVLYRLFNEKYASTRPGFDDLMLWGDMKVMFEPNSDDAVWKNHNSQELIEWKLYDSCGVHSLMLGEVSIHMLVEKKYPLPQDTLTRMLRWKLHVNYNVTEMAYELLSCMVRYCFEIGGLLWLYGVYEETAGVINMGLMMVRLMFIDCGSDIDSYYGVASQYLHDQFSEALGPQKVLLFGLNVNSASITQLTAGGIIFKMEDCSWLYGVYEETAGVINMGLMMVRLMFIDCGSDIDSCSDKDV